MRLVVLQGMASRTPGGWTTRTTLQLVGPHSWTPVPAVLTYHPDEPFAVRVRFGEVAGTLVEDGAGVEWMVSRDLLRAGLARPAGEGDVRLWPVRGGTDSLFVHLRTPSGEALFEVSLSTVAGFLRESEALVPRGDEARFLRVDDELRRLLAPDGTDPGSEGPSDPRSGP